MHPDVLIVPEQLHARVPGGIGVYTRHVVSELVQLCETQSISVEIYGSRKTGKLDPFEAFGVPVSYAWLPSRYLIPLWDHKLIMSPSAKRIQLSFSMAGPIPKGKVRNAFAIYDLSFRRYPQTMTARGVNWHEARLRAIQQSGSFVIAISEQTVSELIEVGFDRELICLAPPGADHIAEPDFLAAAKLLAQHGVDKPFLISIGTLEPRKNLPRVFEAFTHYRLASRSEIQLLVVGPDGWGENLLPRDGIIFTGKVTDELLAGLLSMSAALVYVPLYEGFGLPPLEAMARSVPVVASPMPSTSHGYAIIVDPTSVTDIARGIDEVLSSSVHSAELVVQGLDFANQMTWKNTAHKIFEDLVTREI